MKIITFCQIDESLFNPEFEVESFHSKGEEKADIAIIDIESIFEYEENKHSVCKEKYVIEEISTREIGEEKRSILLFTKTYIFFLKRVWLVSLPINP